MEAMNLRNLLVPVGVAGVLVFGYMSYGWPGVAAVGGGLVMWALLHFTRLMHVMKKAANRPVGYVSSAVMLNARLTEGVTLLHVVTMTQALGELRSPADTQPEVYRWTDGTQSHVTGEFHGGRLKTWTLVRPDQSAGDAVQD